MLLYLAKVFSSILTRLFTLTHLLSAACTPTHTSYEDRIRPRGRILGRNPNRMSKEFFSSLLATVTPTGLPWDFFFFKLMQHMVLKNHTKTWSRELSRLCLETSTKLYVHEFGFRVDSRLSSTDSPKQRSFYQEISYFKVLEPDNLETISKCNCIIQYFMKDVPLKLDQTEIKNIRTTEKSALSFEYV